MDYENDKDELIEIKKSVDKTVNMCWEIISIAAQEKFPDKNSAQWLIASRVVNRLWTKCYTPVMEAVFNCKNA